MTTKAMAMTKQLSNKIRMSKIAATLMLISMSFCDANAQGTEGGSNLLLASCSSEHDNRSEHNNRSERNSRLRWLLSINTGHTGG